MTKEMPAFQCGQGQDLTGAPAASCLLTALSPLAQDNMQSRLDRVRLSGRVTTVFMTCGDFWNPCAFRLRFDTFRDKYLVSAD